MVGKLSSLALSGLLVQLTASLAISAPITSAGQLNGATTVIDFSQFTGGNQYFGVNGPVQIGGNVGMNVTASSSNGALYLYNGNWGLLNNGQWDGNMNGYLGIWPNNGPVTIDFHLAENVSGVGAFMNYIVGQNYSSAISISAYDVSDNLLESYDVLNDPISTPGGIDAGAFRGIQRNTADIASIRIYGQGIVMDNLTFTGSAAVPEPGTLALFGLGMVGLVMGLRRKSSVK